ncbi:MAG: hypothetical protein MJ128_02825 [Mogibacterium sp.]|nr:hypothetical protein [Mogibacterium sp.]
MKFGWINLFGAIIVLLIIIPNIIYALRKKNETEAPDVPQYLTVCEQTGRYGCIILMWLPLMVWEFGFKSNEEFVIYLFLNGILIIIYYLYWAGYFKQKTLKKGLVLAIIPTTIFLVSALLLRHWLLAFFALLFGFAHIRITCLTHQNHQA